MNTKAITSHMIEGSINVKASSKHATKGSVKGILQFRVDLDWRVTMVSGIVYVFLGFLVHDWSCAVEFTNYGVPHWGIDNYWLILLNID